MATVNKVNKVNNVIIIGSGPAGYSAGLYAARADLNPILFEGSLSIDMCPGGQLTTTSLVENYLGFDSINGLDLTDKFKEHAIKYGLNVVSKLIIKVDFSEQPYKLTDEDGLIHLALSVIIATGANAKKLGMKGEERLWHHGISACAVCDGSLPIFRRKPIAVVGGGDSAAEEALYLSKFASKIYLIHRKDTFRMSKIMLNRVMSNEKIQVIGNSVIEEANGDEVLEGLTLKNIITNEITQLPVRGLFYGIGHTPNTDFLLNSGLEITADHYVATHNNVFTNIPGVFAAGDVQDHVYRQAITSAGTGCMAALEAERFIAGHHH